MTDVTDEKVQLQALADREYRYGFTSDIETDIAPRGLDEDVIRLISAKKEEPEWLLDWRLRAFEHWKTLTPPTWQKVEFPPIDYQDIIYYAAPKKKPKLDSLDEVDPEMREMFDKLGISLAEQERISGVAVDAVVDSASVATTFQKKLAEVGVIFCSFSEAVRSHPELVQKYLGTVVPFRDNYFATLNSAVFSDGSFCFIPAGVKCPMELSTYFRINSADTGQFERTLIIAEEGASVSYLEGRTAPQLDTNQLHAAVVELVALDDADIKYSTVRTGTRATRTASAASSTSSPSAACARAATRRSPGPRSRPARPSPGSTRRGAPGRRLGRRVLLGGAHHQPPAGRHGHQDDPHRQEHLAARSSPRASRPARPTTPTAARSRCCAPPRARATTPSATRCSSATSAAPTPSPTSRSRLLGAGRARAYTSKIGEEQLFYCRQRGISTEDAVSMIVHGFCRDVFKELPMEYVVEARNLLSMKLEGSVG